MKRIDIIGKISNRVPSGYINRKYIILCRDGNILKGKFIVYEWNSRWREVKLKSNFIFLDIDTNQAYEIDFLKRVKAVDESETLIDRHDRRFTYRDGKWRIAGRKEKRQSPLARFDGQEVEVYFDGVESERGILSINPMKIGDTRINERRVVAVRYEDCKERGERVIIHAHGLKAVGDLIDEGDVIVLNNATIFQGTTSHKERSSVLVPRRAMIKITKL